MAEDDEEAKELTYSIIIVIIIGIFVLMADYLLSPM